MKKISKKIVALATMAAFVLTLVPVAAFGAANTTVQTSKEDLTIEMQQDNPVKATVNVTVGSKDVGHNIFVWLTDNNDNDKVYRYAKVTATSDVIAATGDWNGAALIGQADATDGKQFAIEFTIPDAGEYTVNAGSDLTDNNTGNFEALTTITPKAGYDTVTVKAQATKVSKIEVAGATATQSGGSINYDGVPNGIRSTEVVATVTSAYANGDTGTPSSDGKILTVENPYSNLTILNADGEETNEITVDGNTATFYVKAAKSSRNTTYTLTLKAENVSYKLSVVVSSTDNKAATIETVDTGMTAIAKDTLTTPYARLDDVAQFVVKNADGDVLTADDTIEGFTAFTGSGTGEMGKNIGVTQKPADCNPQFKVVKSNEDPDQFTLQVKDPAELPVGEYTVVVALDNANSAEVSFTVANFGTVQDTIVEITDSNGNVVDEVVDKGTYTATAYEVDENGLKRILTSASMGVKGSAATNVDSTSAAGKVTFIVTDDKSNDDNAYIGSKIGVYAFTTPYDPWAYAEVTVVDAANVDNYTLEFDPTTGVAGEDNTVGVTVVDENGKKVEIEGNIYVTLVDSSVEDANVYVNKKVDVKDGEGSITINSDKETELEIIVGVMHETSASEDDQKNIVIANTLNYTVGQEDPNTDTLVGMTIGSTDYIVNNDVVKGDASPYIDANWRTMVPVAVLANTFGGTATWDGTDRTVTVVNGDTTVVMTIDDTTYTINGTEAEMDTAPVIGEGDRTYVPVRFLAEALGYTVTPLKDANGLTAGVVFQK